jgi:hypothetical protein
MKMRFRSVFTMKKYIIIGGISGIGGWQLYIDAKAKYMKETGWEVVVFGGDRTKKVKITGLKEYIPYIMPEISQNIVCFTTRQKNNIVERMIRMIGAINNDEIIIESTSIRTAFWGELLARELNAKHFVYLLHSHIPKINKTALDYFSYKYNRHELAGMTEQTIPMLFKAYRNIDESKTYGLRAMSENPIIKDDEHDHLAKQYLEIVKDCDYLIGSFGTLHKPHTLKILEDVIAFTRNHQEKQFAYIVIGSSSGGLVEEKIKKRLKFVNNIKLLLVEEMFPVPELLFDSLDVCIASWGCATVAGRTKTKTVRLLNDIDTTAIGVVGYTLTKEPFYKFPYEECSLVEMLEDILINRKYERYPFIPPSPHPSYRVEFIKHMDFLHNMTNQQQYYNINRLKYFNYTDFIRKMMFVCLGIEKTLKVIEFIKIKRESSRKLIFNENCRG